MEVKGASLPMMNRYLLRARSHSRRGFTAAEIAMVATVIAILSLLVLPLFRNRTEEARITAAHDEARSLAMTVLLVEADIGNGFLPRLADLDNGEQVSVLPAIDIPTEPPVCAWNATLETPAFPMLRDRVVDGWKGPYASFKRYLTFEEIENMDTRWWSDQGGPLWSVTGGNTYSGLSDEPEDRHPADPWGLPYIFYGRETTARPSGAVFNFNAIYSLGPDGLPGGANGALGSPPDIFGSPLYLDRDGGYLGDPDGDDIEFRF